MAAQTATMRNPAIRALYARQKARGKRGDVALGHCMRKLIHLVFAIWKTGRSFDPTHYPWENVGDQPTQSSTQAPNEMQMAAGHNGGMPLTQPVVAAATPNVKPSSTVVNRDEPDKRRRLDFAAIRQQVTMIQVLEHLGWLQSLKGRRPQLRGPCPIHGQAGDSPRSFSVHLDKQVFRCFHGECAVQGNVLDLWAAVRRMPLYEATVDLARTFNLNAGLNREEEPVSRVRRKPR
jgi:hypothetical protein